MRITMVIGGLGGGGAERVCVNLANAWVEHGWQVTILTVSQNSVAPAYAVDPRVTRRDIGWPRVATNQELNTASIAPVLRGLCEAGCVEQLTQQIMLLTLLRHAILAESPDIVVAHLDLTNLCVLAAMHETNVPIIVCEHTDTTRISLGPWQNARAALYLRAHAVVASHAGSAAWLAERGASAFTIPNPLETPPVRLRQNRKRFRLVTLTRLAHEKRPDLFVRAVASIAGDFPDWDFGVYGAGPLRAGIATLIEKLAPGRIQLHGFASSAYDVLNNADLFVSTSWVEGFGNSIWEALACGVPVVAMEAGAPVRSLIRDCIDGLIVAENSVEALASALASLMRDHEKRKEFAVRAREVVERFPIEASLEKWDELLAAASRTRN
jgi:glycosyltransferase involved in cell wall biosynthesis